MLTASTSTKRLQQQYSDSKSLRQNQIPGKRVIRSPSGRLRSPRRSTSRSRRRTASRDMTYSCTAYASSETAELALSIAEIALVGTLFGPRTMNLTSEEYRSEAIAKK